MNTTFIRNSMLASLLVFFGQVPLVEATTNNWTAASGVDLRWATAGNWNPGGPPGATDVAWFNNNSLTNGQGIAFADNFVTASTSISGMLYSNNTAALSHNTLISPGVTLTISNTAAAVDSLFAGSGANISSIITNTISGAGGKLVMTNTQGRINIRATSNNNNGQNSMLDLSALDTFNAGIARLLLAGDNGAVVREVGTLFLAKTNTLYLSGTSPAINIGDNPGTGVGANLDPTILQSSLYLGQTNTIFVDSVTVGRQKSAGQMLFNPAFTNGSTPGAYIRGASAARVTTFSVSDQSPLGASNQRSFGLVDFTGGIVDAMFGTLNVALGKNGNNTSTFSSEVGILNFEKGTIDVNTVNIGCEFVATSTGPGPTGTVNVNGTGTLVVNTAMNLANHGASPATPAQGTLNVNGTFTARGSIFSGGGTSTINFVGGTFNGGFSGVVMGTAASPITSLSCSNTVLNLAPTFTATNVEVVTLTGVAGTTNRVNLAVLPAITNYPVQLAVIQYTTSGGDLSTFVLGTMPTETPPYQGYLTNDTSLSQIYLVLTNGIIGTPPPASKTDVWNGITNGIFVSNWDTVTTNWTVAGTPVSYANLTLSGLGDLVTFDDTAAGTNKVNLTATLSPASIVVSNTNKDYTFAGTGKISGATSLTMQGNGTLTLAETGGDNFSGGVIVNSGKVIIDNDSSGITGGTLINGGLLQIGNNDANGVPPSGTLTNNGALVFNRANNTLSLATVIAGSGVLSNIGPGMVTLTGVETLTGPVVVSAGTLAFAGPNANPSGISKSSGLTINNGGTVQVNVDNALAGSTGKLPITINAGGVLTGLGSLNGGGGASSHIAGILTLNGGTLTDGGSQLVPGNGTWDLNGGVAVPGGPVTSIMACLDIVPNETGGTLFNVTNGTTPSGIDLLVSGSLINGTGQHDTGIFKNGPGVMAVDGFDTYIQGTTINGGTLQAGLPSDTAPLMSPFGSGPITILNPGSILNLASAVGVTVSNSIGDDSTGLVLCSRGTNYLLGANSYSGATVVLAGALVLSDPGSINGSISIIVSNATLDISATLATFDNPNSVSLTNSTFNLGANLVTMLNSLAVSNTTLALAINTNSPAPNLNLSGGLGILTTGGTTNRIIVSGLPALSVFPATFTLIKYLSLDAGVTNANNILTTLGLQLPAAGSPAGYLTNNTSNGSIDLVITSVTATPPQITGISVSGPTLTISATGGLAGGPYVLLSTTNLALPLSQWTPVLTNAYDGSGNATLSTNIINPADGLKFYILSQ